LLSASQPGQFTSGQKLRIPSPDFGGSVDFRVYTNVRMESLSPHKDRGMSLAVSFEQLQFLHSAPPQQKKKAKDKRAAAVEGQTDADRIQFWTRTKQLMTGSLLCLHVTDTRTPQAPPTLLFATVTDRDAKKMADKDRAVMSIQCTNDKSFTTLLSTTVHHRITIFTSVQAYFEAYRHVLEALQHLGSEPLPFARYLIDGYDNNFNPNIIPMPQYISQFTKFDISPMLKEKSSEPVRRRRRESIQQSLITILSITILRLNLI
jgi:hypothetical protein